MTAPVPVISAELKTVLRHVKLGRCLDTLPERLALAKSRNMGHAEFLELVLSDEVTRRETTSAALRAKGAGLDQDMCLEHWDETTEARFDHQIWDELCSLRFVDAGHNVMIMGPVGVGKTFMATALGHRRAPALQRRLLPYGRPFEAAAGDTPRQQPRRRDAQADAGRPAHP
jgi:DNA replication protein DnaC